MNELSRIISRIKFDEPLGSHCTMRIGGPARVLAFPEDRTELRALLGHLYRISMPFKVVGKGANLLISDKGFDGAIIILGDHFQSIEQVDTDVVQVGAGLSMASLAWQAARMGISGFEFAAQIPGTVGGGVVNNAGAFQVDFTNRVVSVTVFHANGDEEIIPQRGLGLEYRKSNLKGAQGIVLVSATFQGQRKSTEDIIPLIQEYGRKRNGTQPTSQYSSGCIFKNPGGKSAGFLIDDAGLKGSGVGEAYVSDKHANFIVNRGHATACNVLDLIHKIQDTVYNRHDIELEAEVEIVGEDILHKKAA